MFISVSQCIHVKGTEDTGTNGLFIISIDCSCSFNLAILYGGKGIWRLYLLHCNNSLFVVLQIAAIHLRCRFNILSSTLSKQIIYWSVQRVDSQHRTGTIQFPLFYMRKQTRQSCLPARLFLPPHVFVHTARATQSPAHTFVNTFKAWPSSNDGPSQYLSSQFEAG